jgi:predicted metal-dependent HD superfamily phosphohydrolase
MSANNEIVKQAQVFVEALLAETLPQWAVYHDLAHTEETVAAAEEIAEGSKLNKSDTEVVLLAAWFHDVGYAEGVEGHEEKSAERATQFLQSRNYPQEKIELVSGCIRATKIPQTPRNLLEQIVCDADMSHLGKKRFFDRSALLRVETELRTGKTITDSEWLQRNIEFASNGSFFTDYARKEFSARRQKNLILLQEQLRADETTGKLLVKKDKAAAKAEKEKKPERGIETMFRVVPKNHLDLTALADHKSNILIGTNGTILAIVFGLLGTKLDTHPFLLIPTIIITSVCITTMVFAILATRPNVTSGTFTREDIRQRKVNLLFFGNFHKSSLEDFDWGMREMMNDSDYLYGSMIKDLYFLGKVLGAKFHYLRIAYTIFMWGLIISVIAFAVAMLTSPSPVPLPAQ